MGLGDGKTTDFTDCTDGKLRERGRRAGTRGPHAEDTKVAKDKSSR